MHTSVSEAPVAVNDHGVVIRLDEWGGMTVALQTFPAGTDTEPIFKGLPDDRCQVPHWGYVVRGRIRVRYSGREEILTAGDAYYLEPGHTTRFEEDTEVIEFSPKGDYRKTLAVAERNVAAMRASASPV